MRSSGLTCPFGGSGELFLVLPERTNETASQLADDLLRTEIPQVPIEEVIEMSLRSPSLVAGVLDGSGFAFTPFNRVQDAIVFHQASQVLVWDRDIARFVPAMHSTSSGVRGSIPAFFENLDDDLTPFEPLLADPDLHVRIYAVRAFAKGGALAALRARLPDETNEPLRAAIAKHLNV